MNSPLRTASARRWMALGYDAADKLTDGRNWTDARQCLRAGFRRNLARASRECRLLDRRGQLFLAELVVNRLDGGFRAGGLVAGVPCGQVDRRRGVVNALARLERGFDGRQELSVESL